MAREKKEAEEEVVVDVQKVGKKAKELTVAVYKIFAKSRDFGCRDQIQRASISIMNNISEGLKDTRTTISSIFLFMAKRQC